MKNQVSHSKFKHSKQDILKDYKIVVTSRYASLLGRKEVLSGKAKFGIFGDGKELAQVALAKFACPGDWRSGYYRDQSFMMALGLQSLTHFFAQLFADSDPGREPHSAGRQMNNHFATRFIAEDGTWLNQLKQFHSSSDISPTAGQMARLLGLGYASKIYRNNTKIPKINPFSSYGDEVAFGMIGNASTSEGLFWETFNAMGVLQVPIVMSVWDDEYGISVPNKLQTTKGSISDALAGFQIDLNAKTENRSGVQILKVKGWDYQALCQTFEEGVALARKEHIPVLFHVVEMTQPQGHSTSGSHERYKSAERLKHEQSIDCMEKFAEWICAEKIATKSELEKIQEESSKEVFDAKEKAWDEFQVDIIEQKKELQNILSAYENDEQVNALSQELARNPTSLRRSSLSYARRASVVLQKNFVQHSDLQEYVTRHKEENSGRYSNYFLAADEHSPLSVEEVSPIYSASSQKVDGRQVIQKYFDELIARDPRVFVIGEDIGKLGGVNLEFDGLQEKHGELRVSDTGIREATIFGQGMGAAMRGLRPVVDIQYLDYVLYCFQGMSDDLATLRYRSAGGQASPVIVRSKGHRLEGIWHTGSPMAVLLGGLRGIHICVPRNMVQAAGFYQTLMQGDDPGLVIEVLNGYRLKETMPDNVGTYNVPLGVPEILSEGTDVTVVTYGACVRIAQEAVTFLATNGISVELIDVQTLLPFDRNHMIRTSLEKTNALLCLDEDVPGGATAFMMQQIIEVQKAFEVLDVAPRTLSAKAHRGAYASDADYFCKPSAEDIIEMVQEMLAER